jgi:muramoyltetrapeptide carboxypeptidase
MKRKQFLKAATALGALPLLPANLLGASLPDIPEKFVKPPRLNPGDTLAVIAPAGVINENELKESVENIKKLGFEVVVGRNTLNRHGYFAGRDQQRADDVNEMFTDPDIKGIVCARGGYGAARILEMLDFELINRNPKVFIGYSDITILHIAFAKMAKLISFHGPVGTSTYNEYSVENFRQVLMPGKFLPVFYKAQNDGTTDEDKMLVIRSGEAEGWLAGGNLSLLVSLIGTPYDISYDGALLYLEEVGEEPYRIDRMLTQLIQAGKLNKVAGIICGVFKNCTPREKESGINSSFSLFEVLYDRLYDLHIPVLYGMSFGHLVNKIVLPFGVRARFSTGEKILELTESAVD